MDASEGPDVPGWAVAHADLSFRTTALDVGAGWGRFARPLLERAEALRYLVCADISLGMLRTCRLTLADARGAVFFVAGDVRTLPFAPGFFDVVVANHMPVVRHRSLQTLRLDCRPMAPGRTCVTASPVPRRLPHKRW